MSKDIGNKKTMKLNQLAKEYALKCHSQTNHFYDGDNPYAVHLQMVVDTMHKFAYCIPESDIQIVEAACWCHDVIEDTRQSYNDVKKMCGEQVADIVYALTNEKGKTRTDRANDKYYEGIVNTKYATFVKLCDRIANVEYALKNKSDMFVKYRNENENFFYKIHGQNYFEMTQYLIDLFIQ